MEKEKELDKVVKKIFAAKKEFHKQRAKMPIEEKIKILIELQKIGKKANPEKTKNKRIWKV
jgi:hypothetical protein